MVGTPFLSPLGAGIIFRRREPTVKPDFRSWRGWDCGMNARCLQPERLSHPSQGHRPWNNVRNIRANPERVSQNHAPHCPTLAGWIMYLGSFPGALPLAGTSEVFGACQYVNPKNRNGNIGETILFDASHQVAAIEYAGVVRRLLDWLR